MAKTKDTSTIFVRIPKKLKARVAARIARDWRNNQFGALSFNDYVVQLLTAATVDVTAVEEAEAMEMIHKPGIPLALRSLGQGDEAQGTAKKQFAALLDDGRKTKAKPAGPLPAFTPAVTAR